MKLSLLIIACFLGLQLGFSQSPDLRVSDSLLIPPSQEVNTEVDFLFHYYDQDGQHSAVTGGVGTEELNDYDTKIKLKIPLDSISQLKIYGGVNVYTSASTDRIDRVISSASKEDIQAQLNVYWEEAPQAKKYRYGISMGGATESDYLSGSIGGFLAWGPSNKGREWQINTQLFFDRWQLFFPDELRGTPEATVATDRRNDFQLGLNLSQIITKRLQASIGTDLSFQQGLLSTPFHRVYLNGNGPARLERFPSTRFKIPLGLRLHYFLGDLVISRFYYRYYWDTFRLRSHSTQLELAFKLGQTFTLSPAYRFHQQRASIYFAPFREHSGDAVFYTSDFDLSTFTSQQWALGLKYAPIYGLGRWRYKKGKSLGTFKSWECRVARYRRSDGLQAFVVSTALSFRFSDRK